MFNKLTAVFNRYLTAIGDQQLIDQRIKELFEIEKEVTIKRAYLGDAEVDDLRVLTHSEQVKLLRALILQKIASDQNTEGAIAALASIENKPPHTIKYDHLYSIPVLSEIGNIIRFWFTFAMVAGVGIALTTLVKPTMCNPIETEDGSKANNSLVCNANRNLNSGSFIFDARPSAIK